MKPSIFVLFGALYYAVAIPMESITSEHVTTFTMLDERQIPTTVKITCLGFSPPSLTPLKSDVRALAKTLVNKGTTRCGVTRNKGSSDQVYKTHAKSSKTEVNLYFTNNSGTKSVYNVWYDCKKLGDYLNAFADTCGKNSDRIAGTFYNSL